MSSAKRRFVWDREKGGCIEVEAETRRTMPKWPIVSAAAGVAPSQIPQAQQQLAEAGVPTEFTAEGDPIFRDRTHRARALQAMHLHDRDGGYGDG